MKYKIGDIVKTSKGKGVIIGYNKGYPPILVKLDNPDHTCHDGNGIYLIEGSLSEKKDSWYFKESEIKIISSVTNDHNTQYEISFDI